MATKEFEPPYWKVRATELFFGEFDTTKEFHEKYSFATDFYYELAKRVVEEEYVRGDLEDVNDIGRVTYRWMYDAYRQDAKTLDYEQLNDLIGRYQAFGAVPEP